VAEAGAADGRQEEKGQAQEGDFRQGGIQGPVWPLRSRCTAFKAPPAAYGDYAFILHILASLTDDGRAGIVCPQGVLFRGQPEVEEETGEFDDDGNPIIKRRKADDEHLIRKALT
jgi:type I restriction enzyme M protein